MGQPTGLCECGCGQATKIATGNDRRIGRVKGQPIRFISGHQTRNRIVYEQIDGVPAKRCNGCGKLKVLTDYFVRSDRPNGRMSRCKTCEVTRKVRNRRKAQLGIPHDEYERMVAAQGGSCAICGRHQTSHNGRGLDVDHDHQTGAVRGLLCSRCNTAIGLFGDDPEVLRRAIRYLKEAQIGGRS